jgi:nitroreductase
MMDQPTQPTGGESPEASRLDMPLREAMATQRAIRRLKPDPVDDEVVLRCIELALKAPTGSNAQNWEWILVRDPAVKRTLARLNRIPWSVYGRAGRIARRDDPKMLRVLDAVQWQADHYEEIPVLVVPCLRGLRFNLLPFAATAWYGSIYPAVQNFLLACRAEGLGAALTTLPLWSMTLARRALGLPFSVQPVAVIPVGWPRGRYGPTTRKSAEAVVHHDRYGNRPASQ